MSDESTTWHADPMALRDYANGSAAAPVAWSVESHLPTCSTCRAVLAELVTPADATLLTQTRTAMVLPSQVRRRSGSLHAGLLEGVLGPWWAWIGLIAVGAVAMWLAGQVTVPAEQVSLGLSWALALSPLVPVGMVAVVYGVADRDATVQATPRGGLELVLIRTASILTMTIPVVTVAMWASGTFLAVWLLPALGLSLGAVALGVWIGVERAAVGLTILWAVVVALAMLPGSGLVQPLAPLINPDGIALALWGAVVACAVAVVMQPNRFDAPGRNR